MQIGPDILKHLDEHGVHYEVATDPKKIIPLVDVVYQTRIDPDRLRSKDLDPTIYNLNTAMLSLLKSDAVLLHPLPRSVEIDPAVDNDPRAAYFRQAQNGLYVRMALLTMLLDP